MSGSRGTPRAGRGGAAKSGKPRVGTGGYGRKKLEGKGPTPPAHMRTGHPAQRRAAKAASGGKSGGKSGREGSAGAGTRDAASGWDSRRPGRATDAPGRRARVSEPPERATRRSGEAPEVVAGRNAVVEALRARVPAIALYAGPREDTDERVRESVTLAAKFGIPMIEAGRAELDRLTDGAVHQGLALRVRPYAYAHAADLSARAVTAGEPALVTALDGVTDPRNLGAVVRSVAAFGGHGVLVPARRSAGVTAGAWKASAGALARVPVARAPNLVRALASYQEEGLFVVGLDTAGPTTVRDLEIADGPVVLVIGSEGRGLSRLVSERCDLLARIPMAAATESLNAGVAAGIALHEIAVRRATSGHD